MVAFKLPVRFLEANQFDLVIESVRGELVMPDLLSVLRGWHGLFIFAASRERRGLLKLQVIKKNFLM